MDLCKAGLPSDLRTGSTKPNLALKCSNIVLILARVDGLQVLPLCCMYCHSTDASHGRSRPGTWPVVAAAHLQYLLHSTSYEFTESGCNPCGMLCAGLVTSSAGESRPNTTACCLAAHAACTNFLSSKSRRMNSPQWIEVPHFAHLA